MTPSIRFICMYNLSDFLHTNDVGVNGYEGDGDITRPDNLVAFREYVMSQTEGRGVHFVMADGVSVVTLYPNIIQYCIM